MHRDGINDVDYTSGFVEECTSWTVVNNPIYINVEGARVDEVAIVVDKINTTRVDEVTIVVDRIKSSRIIYGTSVVDGTRVDVCCVVKNSRGFD